MTDQSDLCAIQDAFLNLVQGDRQDVFYGTAQHNQRDIILGPMCVALPKSGVTDVPFGCARSDAISSRPTGGEHAPGAFDI
jgi:hypothetical protein